jgi:hypothetical protein
MEDVKIIQEICSSFDVSLYDKLSSDTKKYLLEYIKTIKSKSRKVNALLKMLSNRASPVVKYIDILQGPVSVIELKGPSKHIYLFGDRHVYMGECEKEGKFKGMSQSDISSWMYQNIKNSDKFIDLFIEKPYHKTDKLENISSDIYIDKLHNKFKECASIHKDICPIPNMRYHYSDIRRLTTNKDLNMLMMILTDFFNVNYGTINYYFTLRKDDKAYRDAIEYVYTLLYYVYNFLKNFKTYKNLLAYLSKNYKVDKQISNIKDAFIKEKLLLTIESFSYDDSIIRWNDRLDLCRLFLEDMRVKIDTNAREIPLYYKELTDLLFLLFNILNHFFELYILGRIFRSYDDKKELYSKPAQNIIVFTGYLHTINIKNMLINMGFKIIFKTGAHSQSMEPKSQCMDISKMKQPLFG